MLSSLRVAFTMNSLALKHVQSRQNTGIFCKISALFLAASLSGGICHATSATWIGGSGTQLWATGANWSTGTAPGSTTVTNSTDTATFNTVAGSTITIDSGRDIGSLIFDGAAGAYTIGSAGANAGNALELSSAGSITLGSTATSFTGTATTETVNAPLTLEGATATTAGTYSFINNSTTSSDVLSIAGNVSGGTTSTIALTLGGANTGSNIISGVVANGTASALSLTKTGLGTWILTGADTYTGATTINGAGTLQIGNGTSGNLLNTGTYSALTFGASGGTVIFNEAAGSTQNMGALTYSSYGDDTIQSNYAGSGSDVLNFASLGARTAGSTQNFVAANGTSNEISFTTATAGFISPGSFFGGSNYAYINSTNGYVRAIAYGSDANALTSSGGTSLTGGASINQQITGAITGQTTTSFNTLNISGSNNFNINNLGTVSLNGILQSGGGTSTIASNGIISNLKVLTSGGELIVRTDSSSDNLTISTNFAANGTNAFTKSGAGTLTLQGSSALTGTVYLDAGKTITQNTNALGLGTGVSIAAGANLDLDSAIGLSLNNLSTVAGATITATNGASTLTDNFSSYLTLAGSMMDGTSGTLAVSYQNTVNSYYTTITGTNTYSGGTTIGSSSGNVFSLRGTNTSYGTGPITIYGGISATLGTSGQTLSNAITLDNASNLSLVTTINGGSPAVVLSGAVTLGTAQPILEVAGSGAILTISGAIGDGGNGHGLTYSADNTDSYSDNLVLNGANTFSGSLILQPATNWASIIDLQLNNVQALGTGTFIINSNGDNTTSGGGGTAKFDNTSSGNETLTTNNAQVWNGDFLFGGTHNLTFGNGAISLGTVAQKTRTINVAGSVLTENGGIADGTNATTSTTNLSKTGAGTLALNGTSSYDGGTYLLAGTITTGNSAALGTSQVSVGGGTTLNLNNTALSVGSLTTGVTAPTVVAGSGYTFGAPPTITVSAPTGGGTTATAVAVVNVVNGQTTGGISVIITNAGSGYTSAPTYTISGGTGTGASITAPAYATGSVTTGGTSGILTILGNNSSVANYNGVISGTGSVVKQGSGIQEFSGTNTYSGGTTFNGGALNLGSAGAIGTTGTLSFTGGTLQYSSANATDYSARFSTAAGQAYSLDSNGRTIAIGTAIGGSQATNSLTYTDSSASPGSLTLSTANTYGGGTTVNGGTLNVSNSAGLGATTGSLTVSNLNTANAGTATVVNLYSGATTTGSLGGSISTPASGTNSATINLGTSLTVNQTSARTYAGVLAGSSSSFTLGASSTSSLALSGANTYGGGTTVNAGTLYVNGGVAGTSSGSGTGSVTVNGGTLAGGGVIRPTSGTGITLGSSGTLSSGQLQTSTATAGQDVVTGSGLTLDNQANLSSNILSVSSGSTLTFSLGAGSGGSALSFSSPNTNSTYINVLGNKSGEINFATGGSGINIKLVDLTAFSTTDTLQLRYQTPYLLMQTAAADNSDFANLVTTGGVDQNGYVLGVGTSTSSYTAFNISATDINNAGLTVPLNNLQLYLYNGDLEVVPEPGTWAMLLGGIALLLVFQQRRNKRLF